VHPEYVIYGVNLEFSAGYLRENLAHLHGRLAHVSFFSATHAWFTAAAFLLLLAALLIYNRKGFLAALLVPLIILISLASNKGGDGSMWPFYSFGRSYLGLPLVIAFFVTLLPPRNLLATGLVLAALATGAYKLATFRETISGYYDESKWLGVHLVKVDDALHAMKVYKEACEKQQASQLMVSNNFWLNTVLAYGGGAVHNDFPVTFETNNERRYWLREGLADRVVKRFVYISSRSDLEQLVKQDGFRLRRLDDYGLYLVTGNTLTNGQFIRRVWEAEK
jgi:hypothetical protein